MLMIIIIIPFFVLTFSNGFYQLVVLRRKKIHESLSDLKWKSGRRKRKKEKSKRESKRRKRRRRGGEVKNIEIRSTVKITPNTLIRRGTT